MRSKKQVIAEMLRAGRPDLANQIVVNAEWFYRAYQFHVAAMSMQEARELLDVKDNANHDVINKAYKEKAFQFHPDRGGDPSDMVKINVARDILLGKQRPEKGYGPAPSPTYRTKPHKPPKKVRITFEEAARKANVPTSGVEWKFITDSGYGGYGDKHYSGRVLYGTDKQNHIFVGIFEYRNLDMTTDTDIYEMWVSKDPISKSIAKVAPAVIRALWKNFDGCKQYNAKMYVIDPPEKKLDKKIIYSLGKRRRVSFKDGMALMGQDVPAKWGKKVDIVLEVGREQSGFGSNEVTLVVNGKPFKLNDQSLKYIQKKHMLTVVFGDYFYPDSKKNLTKMRKRKDEILGFLLAVCKKTNEPEALQMALQGALGKKAKAVTAKVSDKQVLDALNKIADNLGVQDSNGGGADCSSSGPGRWVVGLLRNKQTADHVAELVKKTLKPLGVTPKLTVKKATDPGVTSWDVKIQASTVVANDRIVQDLLKLRRWSGTKVAEIAARAAASKIAVAISDLERDPAFDEDEVVKFALDVVKDTNAVLADWAKQMARVARSYRADR